MGSAQPGKTLAFGDVAEAASGLAVPETVALKSLDQFKFIGKDVQRLDVKDKTVGAPIFALDLERDDMLVAAVARPPSSVRR